jgi:hypothetical protein
MQMKSRHHALMKNLILASCLFLLVGCGEPLLTPTLTPTYDPTTGPTVRMTGTLVKQDGSSLNGDTIMASGVDTQGSGIVLGPDGVPLNPDGLIDQNNSFTLYPSKAFLEAVGYRFKLVLIPTDSYPGDLLDLSGKPLVITMTKMGASLPLGEIPIR